MPAFAKPGDFCPNEQCADYGKLQKDQESTNRNGKTKAGCQRYQCTSCGKTFTETKGTIFYRRRTAKHHRYAGPSGKLESLPQQRV